MSQKVFVVHGWTYSLDKWQTIVPLLKAQGIEPILLKVPGLTAPSTKVWTIDDYVEWLQGELKGEEAPIVIGHSNGGRIALALLQKYPARFKQLILIDSAGLPHNTVAGNTKLSTLKIIAKAGKPLAKIPVVSKAFYKLIGAQDYRQAPPNMRATMQNMLNADQFIDLSKITIPVTLIWGAEDTATPLKDGRTMHKQIQGSQLHVIDGARHAPHATRAAQVADIITDVVGV
jgi:pimeloyl-ACP methyl ester carboxylesterase